MHNLKEEVCQTNLALVEEGLVRLTWGNASGIDRERGLVVIKPSGVPYTAMTAKDMTVVDLDGKQVGGEYRPSSDTITHLVLYKAFPKIGGVVHTHSSWATSWAQACRDIPCLGTTHADHFYGPVPCTRLLTPDEIKGNYEEATGQVIREAFTLLDPMEVPGVLVAEHGPFTWGATLREALHHAIILEEIARLAFRTVLLGKEFPVQREILDKHFSRKHGPGAYYGQGDTGVNT
ncbi:MAG: L-ribulose-5-phosphate 4-epimerase AraD [Bacteroidales bacterium]